MTRRRTIQVVMGIAFISLSLTLVNPVKAYVFYSEHGGAASTTVEWGAPIALIGEYTGHVLKLGSRALDLASATARGSMYVLGKATYSGWVTGNLKWYMRGTLVAPFLGIINIIDDAWITVKFRALDLTAGTSVENTVLHEHADPITGTQFDGEYSGTLNIPLYDGHSLEFVFDVEVHAEVLGVIAVTVADFGGVFWSDSRIEWRFIDVPGITVDGGGGYCPFVFVWDGTHYVPDNNVLPRSVLSNGADVEDHYGVEKPLVSREGKYSLLLGEFGGDHSYFDRVGLLAVDHEYDVNIALTPRGDVLTYKKPVAPTSAMDNNGSSRLSEIRYMDGNVSDPKTYFQGTPNDYLILNFGKVNSDNAKLILRDDMKKMDDPCILVQVKDGNGSWQTVEVLIPRAYWSIEAVNLSSYIVHGQDLWVRLYWSQPHRLDYVGLDTTKQEDYEILTANLVSATHSTQGDVKALLTQNDTLYAELIPNQQIQLEFTLPNNTSQARTYILYTKGRYCTIP